MIRYDYFTRRQALEWQGRTAVDSADPLTDIHAGYFTYCDPEQLVGIGAWDGERMVGRNLFFHCPIAVTGSYVECVVTNNLFVAPLYRPKGIGTYLKMYVLKLGYPQISSGVSPSMQKVYDAWSAYRRIDAAKTYSVAADAFGVLRVARIAAERNDTGNDGARDGSVARGAFERTRASLRLMLNARQPVRVLDPDAAIGALDTVLLSARRPIQVPWNRLVLRDALRGRHGRMSAWIIELPGGRLQFVSAYRKDRQVRTIGSRQTMMTELLFNEAWPPAEDDEVALACIAFVLRQARQLGASVVQVDAMTPALARICEKFGFDCFYRKRVYIAPNTRDVDLAAILSDPSNWWCRGINENEFEEIALPRAGCKDFSEMIPAPATSA